MEEEVKREEEEIKKQRKNHKSEFTISSKDVLDIKEDNSENGRSSLSPSEEDEEEVEGKSEAATHLRTPD